MQQKNQTTLPKQDTSYTCVYNSIVAHLGVNAGFIYGEIHSLLEHCPPNPETFDETLPKGFKQIELKKMQNRINLKPAPTRLAITRLVEDGVLEKTKRKGACYFRINTERQNAIDALRPKHGRGAYVQCSHAITHELGFKASYVHGKIQSLYTYIGKRGQLVRTHSGKELFRSNLTRIRKDLGLTKKSLNKAMDLLVENSLITPLEIVGKTHLAPEEEAHANLRMKLGYLRSTETRIKLTRAETVAKETCAHLAKNPQIDVPPTTPAPYILPPLPPKADHSTESDNPTPVMQKVTKLTDDDWDLVDRGLRIDVRKGAMIEIVRTYSWEDIDDSLNYFETHPNIGSLNNPAGLFVKSLRSKEKLISGARKKENLDKASHSKTYLQIDNQRHSSNLEKNLKTFEILTTSKHTIHITASPSNIRLSNKSNGKGVLYTYVDPEYRTKMFHWLVSNGIDMDAYQQFLNKRPLNPTPASEQREGHICSGILLGASIEFMTSLVNEYDNSELNKAFNALSREYKTPIENKPAWIAKRLSNNRSGNNAPIVEQAIEEKKEKASIYASAKIEIPTDSISLTEPLPSSDKEPVPPDFPSKNDLALQDSGSILKELEAQFGKVKRGNGLNLGRIPPPYKNYIKEITTEAIASSEKPLIKFKRLPNDVVVERGYGKKEEEKPLLSLTLLFLAYVASALYRSQISRQPIPSTSPSVSLNRSDILSLLEIPISISSRSNPTPKPPNPGGHLPNPPRLPKKTLPQLSLNPRSTLFSKREDEMRKIMLNHKRKCKLMPILKALCVVQVHPSEHLYMQTSGHL